MQIKDRLSQITNQQKIKSRVNSSSPSVVRKMGIKNAKDLNNEGNSNRNKPTSPPPSSSDSSRESILSGQRIQETGVINYDVNKNLQKISSLSNQTENLSEFQNEWFEGANDLSDIMNG